MSKNTSLVPNLFIVYTLITFRIKCIKYFLLTKNHDRPQQIMADPISSYVKKLKDGAVNQVVNDLW